LNWSVGYAPSFSTISVARCIISGIRSGVMPSGLSMTSSCAPKASIVRSFSAAKAFDVTIRSG
jgi:hypothetical protein